MPNSGHSSGDVDHLFPAVIAFQRHVAGVGELPSLGWDFFVDADRGVVRATVYAPATATVQLWQTSSDSADFRESEWTRSAEVVSGPVAEFEIPLPETGMRLCLPICGRPDGSALGSAVTFTTTPFIF